MKVGEEVHGGGGEKSGDTHCICNGLSSRTSEAAWPGDVIVVVKMDSHSFIS